MRKLVLKECKSCHALVRVIEDCNCKCGLVCCGEEMEEVSVCDDELIASKHLPQYEIKDGKLMVRVNHVMDKDHYINWICLVGDDFEEFRYLKPNEECQVQFDAVHGTLYAYCNRHGLWEREIK